MLSFCQILSYEFPPHYLIFGVLPIATNVCPSVSLYKDDINTSLLRPSVSFDSVSDNVVVVYLVKVFTIFLNPLTDGASDKQ